MSEEGIAEVNKQGIYVYHEEFGEVTPTINEQLCVYGVREKNGMIRCAIEHAYNDGKLDWKKPMSCHLFPIKIDKSSFDENLEYVNYEPRTDLCRSSCALGKKLSLPVYQFLKEPIIRKYGEAFYEQLEATAAHIQSSK